MWSANLRGLSAATAIDASSRSLLQHLAMIALIAAISKNGVIGKENALPWYLPEDLKHFKILTTGKTVLMGRKTFESILARLKKPLPDRVNVVITRDVNYAFHPLLTSPIKGEEKIEHSPPLVGRVEGRGQDNVEVYHSVDDALRHHYNEEVIVIGGGEIFRQTIDRANTLHITEVDQVIEGDVYFPRIDPAIWKETERERHEGYSFITYQHK